MWLLTIVVVPVSASTSRPLSPARAALASAGVRRIGWVIIEKGFGGRDRKCDLQRGMIDTLDAIKS
jgi:hypothetical protein